MDGIPREYYQYCYSLDANHTTQQDLSNKIIEIMSIPVEERLLKAVSAREFVAEIEQTEEDLRNFIKEHNTQ